MKAELFVVATSWIIGAGIAQLILMLFGWANWTLFFGFVCGATGQAAVYYLRSHPQFGEVLSVLGKEDEHAEET